MNSINKTSKVKELLRKIDQQIEQSTIQPTDEEVETIGKALFEIINWSKNK